MVLRNWFGESKRKGTDRHTLIPVFKRVCVVVPPLAIKRAPLPPDNWIYTTITRYFADNTIIRQIIIDTIIIRLIVTVSQSKILHTYYPY